MSHSKRVGLSYLDFDEINRVCRQYLEDRLKDFMINI